MTRAILIATFAVALASPAFAQAPRDPGSAPTTKSLQGDAAWRTDPHIRVLYEASVHALAGGPTRVDRAAFEARCRQIFADFGKAHGVPPEAMQDHLKLIPGQIIQIATEDPEMLKTYDNFVVAIFGPE